MARGAHALAHLVEDHGDKQNAAAHDVLIEGRHIEQVERVLRRAHDQHADDDAADGGDAAGQRNAAQHAGGNHLQFEAERGVGLAAGDARGEHDAGQGRHEAMHREHDDLHAVDRHARQPRRFGVAADRQHVAAEHGGVQHNAEDDEARAA